MMGRVNEEQQGERKTEKQRRWNGRRPEVGGWPRECTKAKQARVISPLNAPLSSLRERKVNCSG